MADELILTPQPVRLSAQGTQLLERALPVASYVRLVMRLFVPALEGTGGPQATIRLLTSNQLDSDEGWPVLATFTTATGSGQSFLIETTSHLKFIRWDVSSITGTGAAVTFFIDGVGRDG